MTVTEIYKKGRGIDCPFLLYLCISLYHLLHPQCLVDIVSFTYFTVYHTQCSGFHDIQNNQFNNELIWLRYYNVLKTSTFMVSFVQMMQSL